MSPISETDSLLQQQQKERAFTTLLAVLIASLSCFLFGFGNSSAPFYTPWNTFFNWKILINILSVLCAFIGSLLAGTLIDKIGRKLTILIIYIFYLLGSVFFIISYIYKNPNYQENFFLCANIVDAVAAGMTSHAVPVYISEISSIHLREIMGATMHHMFIYGVLYGTLNRTLINNSARSFITFITVYIAIAFVGFLIHFMPETPRWLLAHRKRNEAYKNLLWLRGINQIAEDEINDIETNLAQHDVVSDNDFRTPGLFRPLLVGSILGSIYLIFLFYYIFALGKVSLNHAQYVLPWFVLQTLLTFIGYFIIHRFSQRFLLVAGSTVFFLFTVTAAILSQTNYTNIKTFLIPGIIIYTTFLTFTWGPISWIIVAEIFPQRARGLLSGFVKSSCWLVLLINMSDLIFPISDEDVLKTFWFISCLNFFCIPFVYFIVPETKGKTLEEIEHYYIMYRGFRNYLM